MPKAHVLTRFASLLRGRARPIVKPSVKPFTALPTQESPMSVQFIGMIQPHEVSETFPRRGPVIDRDFVRVFAQAHEHAGFDRILVPAHATSPDNLLAVTYAASVTQRIKFLLAHRPGLQQPTVTARQLATLDQYTDGRVAVHYITGGTDEYLSVLRQIWTADKPLNHEGRFYRIEGGWSEVKPLQQPHLPIYFGGASEAALQVAGKHASVYALWGESLAQAGDLVRRVRASAAQHGREIDFSISFRPILGRTEDEAWARAERILEDTRRVRSLQGFARGGPQRSEGARRLVGTPEQVADALLKYYDLGISTFLIRGFDPLLDAIDYGRELLPLVLQKVAERDAAAAAQAQLKAA